MAEKVRRSRACLPVSGPVTTPMMEAIDSPHQRVCVSLSHSLTYGCQGLQPPGDRTDNVPHPTRARPPDRGFLSIALNCLVPPQQTTMRMGPPVGSHAVRSTAPTLPAPLRLEIAHKLTLSNGSHNDARSCASPLAKIERFWSLSAPPLTHAHTNVR